MSEDDVLAILILPFPSLFFSLAYQSHPLSANPASASKYSLVSAFRMISPFLSIKPILVPGLMPYFFLSLCGSE